MTFLAVLGSSGLSQCKNLVVHTILHVDFLENSHLASFTILRRFARTTRSRFLIDDPEAAC